MIARQGGCSTFGQVAGRRWLRRAAITALPLRLSVAADRRSIPCSDLPGAVGTECSLDIPSGSTADGAQRRSRLQGTVTRGGSAAEKSDVHSSPRSAAPRPSPAP